MHIPSRRLATQAVTMLLVAVAAAALASWLAPLGWPFELFAHFRWQIGAAAAALVLASLALRRPWMLLVALAAALSQAAPGLLVTPDAVAANASAPCTGTELRIATVNVHFTNRDYDRTLAWLATNPADVVVIQEVTAAWAEALARTQAQYPHRRAVTREDPYGIALLSRWPLDDVNEADFAADGLPSLVARLEVDGRPVQIVALHTHWPISPYLQRSRDSALRRAADQVRRSAVPTVLMGDLNLTPYAPAFTTLLDETGLRDAFAGRAWRPTWRAEFWPLALPIDHVLVPAGSCVVTATIGPDIGSDHRPVRVSVRWAA